ncbi:MAG: GspH/FimT family pseudopilin [Gammaproteobacteria bacterium]|nr:GspH/FimT family pseudopilin [Gammaproteobacteria bacterium]
MNKIRGFNIIELMVTLAILSVLVTVGVPSMVEFVKNNRMTANINDFIVAINVARSEAIKRRAAVSICRSSNPLADSPSCDTGGGTGWHTGWVVFVDDDMDGTPEAADGDGVISTGEAILIVHDALPNFDVDSEASVSNFISFARTGFTRDAAGTSVTGTLLFCDDRGNQDVGEGVSAARALQVSRTGRPQTVKYHAQIAAMAVSC